jgi:putative salt-induced outer membrane protein
MNRCSRFAAAVIAVSVAGGTALAADAPAGSWKGSLGLSYLATTGNSSTQSFGMEFGLTRIPDPWGLDLRVKFLRAEDSGTLKAERYEAGVRASRALGDRWQAFVGASGLRDRFAGIDFRGVLESGATYKMLLGPVHTLSFDFGLAWTSQNPTEGARFSYWGGLAALNYVWTLSKTAALTEAFKFYPNFDTSSGWRLTSETALKASLTELLAIKLGYEFRYDNRPEPGFKKTDTASTVSLVATF